MMAPFSIEGASSKTGAVQSAGYVHTYKRGTNQQIVLIAERKGNAAFRPRLRTSSVSAAPTDEIEDVDMMDSGVSGGIARDRSTTSQRSKRPANPP
jgi:hypothetical protein